jgi:ribosomal protein L11 methyltransferase
MTNMIDKRNNINDDPVMLIAEDHIPHPLHRVSLFFPGTLTGEEAERLAEGLEELCVSVFLHNKEATDGDSWTITLTTYGQPNIEEIKARLEGKAEKIEVEKLPETDWLQHVHENFPPVIIGKFFIYGSHYTGTAPQGLIPLQIDAATAFGSGEHETTRGCIESMEFLASQGKSFKNILDMGCGSGILAIAARKLWPDTSLTAVDIDPESVIVTERHAKMNNVAGMQVEAGDGYKSPVAGKNAPYDMIVSNILAGPLVEMAPELDAVLSPGGYCILSGLLARQEKEVIQAHEAEGLKLTESRALGDWRALTLQKDKKTI